MFTEDSIINKSFKDATIYNGPIKLLLPKSPENKFHAILGLTPTNQIIHATNSFLEDRNFIYNNFIGRKEYDNNHTILTRLQQTYDYMINNQPDNMITESMYLLVNPFSSTNIGHDLSILFERIHYYRQMNINIPVVIGDVTLKIPRAYEIIKLLLPNTTFYILDSDKYTFFNNLIVVPNCIFDIRRHQYLIDEVIKNALLQIDDIDKYKNKKIFLVKTNKNANVVTKSTMFYADKVIDTLEKQYNYICINPETMNMYEIIAYLQYADKIINSYGAINYANALFFGSSPKRYYLNNSGYMPYWDIHLYKIINIDSNLDANIDYLLRNIDEI
jgi:hypothetical protein